MTLESWAGNILGDSKCFVCLGELAMTFDDISDLNDKCSSFKAVGACMYQNSCCDLWDDMISALTTDGMKCTEAQRGKCVVDESNQVVLKITLKGDACPTDEELDTMKGLIAEVLDIPESIIEDLECAKTGRRLLATLDIEATINAVDKAMADAIQKKAADGTLKKDLGDEITEEFGDKYTVEGVADVTPELAAAMNLVPSAVFGLLGLVAGRFMMKA
jgi:hypothetical protein